MGWLIAGLVFAGALAGLLFYVRQNKKQFKKYSLIMDLLAACIVICLVLGSFFMLHDKETESSEIKSTGETQTSQVEPTPDSEEEKTNQALDLKDAEKFKKDFDEPFNKYVNQYEVALKQYQGMMFAYEQLNNRNRFERDWRETQAWFDGMNKGFIDHKDFKYLTKDQREVALAVETDFKEVLDIWQVILNQSHEMALNGANAEEIKQANDQYLDEVNKDLGKIAGKVGTIYEFYILAPPPSGLGSMDPREKNPSDF